MVLVALGLTTAESGALAQVASALAGASPVNRSAGDAPLTRETLMRHVQALAHPALGGRAAGTRGELGAARSVAQVLAQSGLRAEEQSFDAPAGLSRNVYAFLEGRRKDEVVVLGAHMDHLGTRDGVLYPGAEDNASGVAVVLELARALSRDQRKLERSVLVVFFGSEELGMLGSEAFVRNPPVPLHRMFIMVNIDMIGRPLVDQPLLGPLKFLLQMRAPSLGLTGVRARSRLRALLDAAAARQDIELIAPEDLPVPVDEEVERQTRGRGDSVSFERAGVPAVFFGSGESSDYHEPSDTPERIDPEIMQRRARALYDVMIALSNAARDQALVSRAEKPVIHKRRPKAGWYLPIGVSTGVAIHAATSNGAYLGSEASFVHFANETRFWIGGFADALYDFSTNTTRIGVGPELGLGPLGIDGGFTSELSESGPRIGFAVRPVLTLSVLALTGRIAHISGGNSSETFGEIGVLLKAPVYLGGR